MKHIWRLPIIRRDYALGMPVSALQGVDRTDIREIALLFDQTPSGELFIGDVEWVLSPQ
jgi:hypothetical protein